MMFRNINLRYTLQIIKISNGQSGSHSQRNTIKRKYLKHYKTVKQRRNAFGAPIKIPIENLQSKLQIHFKPTKPEYFYDVIQ